MGEKLEPGLYEQVISEKLATLLSTLPEGRSDERRIDPAEGAEVLTGYLSGIVRQGLSEIGEAPRPSKTAKKQQFRTALLRRFLWPMRSFLLSEKEPALRREQV